MSAPHADISGNSECLEIYENWITDEEQTFYIKRNTCK